MEEQRNQCPGVPIRQSSGRSRSEHLKLRHQNKGKKEAPATFQVQVLPSAGTSSALSPLPLGTGYLGRTL